MDSTGFEFIEGSGDAGESAVSLISEPAETGTAEIVVLAKQRLARRDLDAGLADLVAAKAAEFAALSPRERAAIAWTEAVISTGKPHSADETYRDLRRYFDDPAIAKLTALAGTANARARLGALPITR